MEIKQNKQSGEVHYLHNLDFPLETLAEASKNINMDFIFESKLGNSVHLPSLSVLLRG